MSYNSITATPRLLESMIRLSESFSKMRLSNEVSVEDVEEAIGLINFATLKSATDPETGIIDMDILTTGRTSGMRRRAQEISIKIKEFMLANQQKYSEVTAIERFEEDYSRLNSKDNVSREEMIEALAILKSEDFIYVFGRDKMKPRFKLQQFNEVGGAM